MKIWNVVLKWLLAAASVAGHGRLMDPPARNAMWRHGLPNPVNYNDNELYCGGFAIQYLKNGGKCGVCGDDYREKVPRSHEAGGLYANGFIVRRYTAGQVIQIEAELTTNHKGHMEIQLCPNDDPDKIVSEACLESHLLKLEDGRSNSFIIPEDSNKYEIFRFGVQLPEDVTCTHCVLRWKYFAANTWGICANGTEGVGCGEQETFINCADIAIHTIAPSRPVGDLNPWEVYFRDVFPAPQSGSTQGQNNLIQGAQKPQSGPLIVRSQTCVPTSAFARVEGMRQWCMINCLKYPPNCNAQYCTCLSDCKAIGKFAAEPHADIFCHQNCLKHPSHCPVERCACS